MSDHNPHTVCIIGGGMSGLFTGALLAKNGYKVTILEKNHIIGGGLQTFNREGTIFNTGIQSFAGFVPNMITLHLCNYLGITQSLRVKPTDNNAQEIVWLNPKTCYHLPRGREAYVEYLITKFPHEETAIRMMIDKIFHIGKSFDYLYVKPVKRHADNVPYAYMMADEFLRQFVKDEELLTLLSYIGWTTGHSLEYMPALEFCMMLTLYIIGSHRFVGGSQQLVDALCDIIESNQGKVINDTIVKNVEIENSKVEFIQSADGRKWKGDYYIWSCAPKLLLNITDAAIFRPAMMQRVREFTNPFSCNIVFCKLKKHKFHFINSPVYMPRLIADKRMPQTMVLITSPQEDNIWAETIEIYVPSTIDEVAQWKETTVQHRGEEYEKYKLMVAQKALDAIAVYYPNVKDAIENITTATALTIRDYYGNPEGAAFAQQGLYLPIKTKISNLFMTGQAIQSQGLAGIATTSTFLTEVIIGKSLIEEIAKA